MFDVKIVLGVGLLKEFIALLRSAGTWLMPYGLSQGKSLTLEIGEAAYRAPSPYTASRLVNAMVFQVIISNKNQRMSKTITTFRLEIDKKPSYPVSEARPSRNVEGGWILIPAGGGFASVPSKPYINPPITVAGGDGCVGWIGFCFLERNDLTMGEAVALKGKVIGTQADGKEIEATVPACTYQLTDE